MRIWYCPTCGYEVDARGKCHRCRQKLIASPLPSLPAGPEDDEVGYRLAGWADRTRGRLIEALVADGVLHRFEDDDLVVAADDETRVDAIVERVGAGAADDPVSDEEIDVDDLDEPLPAGGGGGIDDEGIGEALHQLWRAASRLKVDPTDMEADGEVAEVSAAVFLVDDYPAVEPEAWAAIGRVTRRLLAALGAEEALDDEIRREASVLAVLLAPVTAQQPAVAVASPPTPVEPAAGDEAPQPGDGGSSDAAQPSTDVPVVDAAAETPVGEADGVDDEDVDRRLLGGGPETSYEVPEWLPDQRALLSVLLDERAIPHAWDGTDLVVPSADETEVEALFDRVGGVADEEDDEARYRAIEELFAAVVRLAADPEDDERSADVLRQADAVEGPTPLGFDDGQWLGLRRRTRTLADSLEHKAHPDVVAAQATTLRDMLRALV